MQRVSQFRQRRTEIEIASRASEREELRKHAALIRFRISAFPFQGPFHPARLTSLAKVIAGEPVARKIHSELDDSGVLLAPPPSLSLSRYL